MSSRDALVERRLALVARSDENRAALAVVFGSLERRLAIAEVVVATARRINRHRVLIGALAVGLIIAPRTLRKWMRRAMGVLPFAIEAYRAITRRRTARNADD